MPLVTVPENSDPGTAGIFSYIKSIILVYVYTVISRESAVDRTQSLGGGQICELDLKKNKSYYYKLR